MGKSWSRTTGRPVITGKWSLSSFAVSTRVGLLSKVLMSELFLETLHDSHPNHTRRKKILDEIKPNIKFGGKIFIGQIRKILVLCFRETHFFPLAAGAETTSVADGEGT